MLRGLLGLPANTREAITWLKRAAENADEENPQALNVLVLRSMKEVIDIRQNYMKNQILL